MNLWDAAIPISAVVFGVLAAWTVERFDRQRGEAKRWKILLGGICAAALAGGSAAEFTTSKFGENAEHHPVLTGALTGAALLGITVLVIDSLIKRAAAQPWRGPLEGTWKSVVTGGRRGADDLRDHLLSGGDRVTAASVPKPEEAEPAHEMARELWIDVSSRVGDAALFAFASDEPDLGESMQELSTAADTLHRALWRWSSETLPHTGVPRTSEDIEEKWRDYIAWLLEVEQLGCHQLRFSSPLTRQARVMLETEKGSHTLSKRL